MQRQHPVLNTCHQNTNPKLELWAQWHGLVTKVFALNALGSNMGEGWVEGKFEAQRKSVEQGPVELELTWSLAESREQSATQMTGHILAKLNSVLERRATKRVRAGLPTPLTCSHELQE